MLLNHILSDIFPDLPVLSNTHIRICRMQQSSALRQIYSIKCLSVTLEKNLSNQLPQCFELQKLEKEGQIKHKASEKKNRVVTDAT